MKYFLKETINNPYLDELFRKLIEISKMGFIPAICSGDQSIGLTLLSELGLENTSLVKPNYYGIVINASRRLKFGTNRVNLFAKVPDWEFSNCKSSREIVEKYGYESGLGQKKLYCTVTALSKNPQGLRLRIDKANGLLNEDFDCGDDSINVVSWRGTKLISRLLENHLESVWVKALSMKKGDNEYFHYYEATYTGPPNEKELLPLLEYGTITVDHEISLKNGRAKEKGPLFKIDPPNLILLFPKIKKIDLTTDYDY